MAADTQARVQFSLQDAQGVRTSLNMPAFVDGAQTLSAVKTAWHAQALLLDAVSGAQITGGSGTVIITDLSGLKGTPAADSRVEEVGNLDFGNATTKYVYDSIIPAILDTVLNSPPVTINEANAAMAAYIASITAAILGGNFSNHDFLPLTALKDSFLSFRRRQRSLHQRSLRVP